MNEVQKVKILRLKEILEECQFKGITELGYLAKRLEEEEFTMTDLNEIITGSIEEANEEFHSKKALKTREKLTNFMMELGIRIDFKTYCYLEETLLYVLENGVESKNIRQNILSIIGEKFNVDQKTIYHAIHRQVGVAYKNNSDTFIRIFKGKPKVKDFIYQSARIINSR